MVLLWVKKIEVHRLVLRNAAGHNTSSTDYTDINKCLSPSTTCDDSRSPETCPNRRLSTVLFNKWASYRLTRFELRQGRRTLSFVIASGTIPPASSSVATHRLMSKKTSSSITATSRVRYRR